MTGRVDTPVTSSFKAALGEQLLAAHGRMRRRRRRRQVGVAFAAMAILALLTTASLSVFDPEPAAAEVIKVEPQPDGSTLVTIERAGALPAEVHAALNDENIKNNTTGVVTGPSRVGAIISLAFDGAASPVKDHASRSLTIQPGFVGVVDIEIGQAALPGQMYEQPTLPFDAGEPLEGFAKPNDAVAVAAAARAKGLRVVILGMNSEPINSIKPGAGLIAALMTSADDLQLRVAP